MSTTSSIETPTSPTAPAPPPRYQHTTTAIVLGAGAAHNPSYKRTHPSLSSFMSPPSAATTPNAANTNNSRSQNQSSHTLLTPSSSTSSSPSVSAAASICASTSAAVHHSQHHPYQQQQQQQYHHPEQQQHHQQQYSYLHHIARPSATLPALCATSTPTSSIKRHTDVSVCSSSSSCCSSSGSVSGAGASANTAAVSPAVVSNGAVITQKLSRTIPSDKINLRLILVSGKTKEFLFNPSDSAGDIAQTVFDNWPEDWEREAVSKAEILRLIYQGRFLHCNVTLGALGLPLGKTTVMHLVPRDNLPEPNSQDQRQKSKGGSSRCCSTTCCIL